LCPAKRDHLNIAKLKRKDIQFYLHTQAEVKGWSAKTFRNHLQSFRTFFSWAVLQAYLQNNPAKDLLQPKLPKPLPRYLTQEEANEILFIAEKNARYSFSTFRNYTWLATFLMTGIRLNELRHLKLVDIQWSQQLIKIRKGKGLKMRLIPIHPKLAFLLSTYLDRKELEQEVWLFPSVRAGKK
jgi:site-specific recombinase XerD